MKSPTTRMLVTIFLGPFGVHKFMDGKIGMGFLYFFTIGLFGIGWIIDSCSAVLAWCKWIISPNKHSMNYSSSSERYHHSSYHSEPEPYYNLNQPFDNMDGHTFEHYCAELLARNGYDNVVGTKDLIFWHIRMVLNTVFSVNAIRLISEIKLSKRLLLEEPFITVMLLLF